MNKLKNKVFSVIFSILTGSLLIVLLIFNIQAYHKEYNNIVNNFDRLKNEPIKYKDQNRTNTMKEKPMFIDTKVYTVIFKDDDISITNHSYEEDDIEDIEEYAKKIISKKNSGIYIGNLYLNDYSYKFIDNNTLIIIDNSTSQGEIYSLLKTSLIILVLAEVLIIYVSIKLTRWIIKPVIESFERQKQFIADASHELKTPISVIMANSEMIETTSKNKKWLDNIKSESERMNKLVMSLLDLARLEQDSSKETYSQVDLSKLVEKTILPFESIMYDNNIKLEYNIDDSVKYFCNEEQIKQLIVILVDNAIKHSDKKGNIIVNLLKNKNEIVIDVKNKGEEIKPGEEEKIFERFYRADESRNRNQNRYGLGLSIAKKIVEAHDGKIKAFSKDNYTTFEVILNNKK
jgi:signal transduction histidine kinase